MSFKFNRNCWVESGNDLTWVTPGAGRETDAEAVMPEAGAFGCSESSAPHPAGCNASLSVDRRIRLAMSLGEAWGDQLWRNDAVCRLLRRLEEDLEASCRAMAELGIVSVCERCDRTTPEGSCCSTGLENKLDTTILLMNALLGVRLPRERERTDSCYFLGARGCKLRVRHMLCVDYLCPELEEALGKESLFAVQAVSGREIETVFLTAEEIKRTLADPAFRLSR